MRYSIKLIIFILFLIIALIIFFRDKVVHSKKNIHKLLDRYLPEEVQDKLRNRRYLLSPEEYNFELYLFLKENLKTKSEPEFNEVLLNFILQAQMDQTPIDSTYYTKESVDNGSSGAIIEFNMRLASRRFNRHKNS